MNVAQSLSSAAERHPDKIALRYANESITYAQMETRAYRAACRVAELGVGRGDRVALLVPNHPKFPILYHAILRVGAVAVTISSQAAPPEIEQQIASVEARLVIAMPPLERSLPDASSMPATEAVLLLDESNPLRDPLFSPEIEQRLEGIAAMDRDDPAAIVFTSGTLDRPRGAILTHGNVRSNVASAIVEAGIGAGDRLLCCVPLSHCFGQNFVMNAAIQAGAELVLHPRWDLEEIVASIERHRVTMFFGVPTMYRRILAADVPPARLASLRYAFSAAAALPLETSRAWRARYAIPIHEGYGLTECSPCASYNHRHHWKEGSVGQPIEGVGIVVAHPATGEPLPIGGRGEVLIRGPNVMAGYYGDPEGTDLVVRDGWLHTGDLGYFDAEGYLFLVGRLREMINAGGNAVSPREVEDVLMTHPEVEDAAVIGAHDDDLGERVKAFVVPREAGRLTAGELKGFARRHLAGYKVPRDVVFVESIPRAPGTGKRLRRLLEP